MLEAAGLLLGSLHHHDLIEQLSSAYPLPVWFIDPMAVEEILASPGSRYTVETLRWPLEATLPAAIAKITLKAPVVVPPGQKLTLRGNFTTS